VGGPLFSDATFVAGKTLCACLNATRQWTACPDRRWQRLSLRACDDPSFLLPLVLNPTVIAEDLMAGLALVSVGGGSIVIACVWTACKKWYDGRRRDSHEI